jgi:hypothetical protein
MEALGASALMRATRILLATVVAFSATNTAAFATEAKEGRV